MPIAESISEKEQQDDTHVSLKIFIQKPIRTMELNMDVNLRISFVGGGGRPECKIMMMTCLIDGH